MKTIIRNAKPADKLLFVLLIVASVTGIIYVREAAPQGNDVLVEIDGREAYCFPLTVDRVVTVDGPTGKTVIEISGRKARVRDASCQNRICQKQGWVASGVIVCLPNRLVVFVGGRSGTSTDVDAVTG